MQADAAEAVTTKSMRGCNCLLTVYCAVGSSAAVVQDHLTHLDRLCHGQLTAYSKPFLRSNAANSHNYGAQVALGRSSNLA